MTSQATLRRLLGSARTLVRERRGAAAVVFAVALPAMVISTAVAVETSLIKIHEAQMQSVADAAAGAGRIVLDPHATTAENQNRVIAEARRIAVANDRSVNVSDSDVVQGWWDINDKVHPDKFGPPIGGQVSGKTFSNAVRVKGRYDHKIAFASLLGVSHVPLAKTGTAYKCSNLDYPYTLVPDDVPAPRYPAMYMSWATEGHGPTTSYYYQQPTGEKNPVIKFYSPYDGEDVSFVIHMSNGSTMQVDTYCAGTYLVAPAGFDARSWPDQVTGTVQRGSTNNSFDVFQLQSKYPFELQPTPYNTKTAVPTPQFDPQRQTLTTPYPNASGTDQYWASQGDPTPRRRTVVVY